MNLKLKILYLGIVLSVLFFLLDAIIGATYYKDLSFIEVLFTAPPYNELYTRIIAITLIAIYGILIYSFIRIKENKLYSEEVENKMSTNPMLMVNISNHIRTPLNAIQGFIELLNDPEISESSKKLYINHIKNSSKYLLELINNVTDITLIETDSMFINDEECKLNELFSDVHTKYSNLIREKGKRDLAILLKTNIKGKDFTIQCDPKRLKQVINNLLENAITFTDEGIIDFGYNASSDNKIEFYVKDSGSGFSAERLEVVLVKSKNIIDSKMAPFDLASLRIKIAKSLVHLMGGELIAKSELNVGSDFRFTLNLKYDNAKAKQEEVIEKEFVNDEALKAQENKMKWDKNTILIAEDVESNFIYLQEILRDSGVQIIWAENGKIAYEKAISNSKIDLVLMDILMPEMDGYEATIKIKKELPHLPIIAQTAYHLDEDDYKDAKLHFNKILIKPIWSYDLMSTLEEFLN